MKRTLLAPLGLILVIGLAAVAVAAPSLIHSGPPNDAFAHAQVVGVGGLIDGSARSAGAERGEPGVGRGARTLWYRWTPSQSGLAYVVPTHPGERPVRVNAYRGRRITDLVDIGRPGAGTPAPLVVIDAFAGRTVQLQVVGQSAFALQIVQPFGGAPPNSSPASAMSLTAQVREIAARPSGTQRLAGATAGLSGGRAGVFFTYTPPAIARGGIRLRLIGLDPANARLDLRIDGHTVGRSGVFSLASGRRQDIEVSGSPAYFTLQLSRAPGFGLDTAPPTVSCVRPSGWTNTNAAVRCRARDMGSGLADPRQRRFTLSTRVPRGALTQAASTGATTVCDRAGNCTPVGPFSNVRVDRTAPAVTCEPSDSRTAQFAVTVNCRSTVSAGGAPLVRPADRSFTLTASLPVGHASAHTPFSRHRPVCNVAGTCTPVPSPGVASIDRIAPQVSCSPGPRGWRTTVTITCRARDRRSKLADPSDQRFTLTTSILVGTVTRRAFSASRSVCDQVANCSVVGPFGPFAIDRQPPVVSCTVPSGWQRTRHPEATCHVRDTGVGLAARTPSRLTLTTAVAPGVEGPVQLGTSRACDRLGNCLTVGPYAVRVDDRPPRVRCAAPPRPWQRGPVTVGCSADDLGSGLAPGQSAAVLTATLAPGRAGRAGFERRRFCDRAGNCTLGPRIAPVRIDRQAPIVRCRALPRRGARGNVTVLCQAGDGRGSGLANRRDRRFLLATSVPAGSRSTEAATGLRTVCDLAGNCTTVGPLRFRVDRRR